MHLVRSLKMLKVLDWYLRSLKKRLARVQTRVGKYQQRAIKINNQMDGVESQIQVVMAKNKGCKKTLGLLKQRSAAIQKKKEAAEKRIASIKKDLGRFGRIIAISKAGWRGKNEKTYQ